MSKSLKKLIDINRLREFKNKLVGTDSAYVQTGAVDQTVAGTKTFSKPIVGSVTGSSGSCTGNAATATKAYQDSNGAVIADTYETKADARAHAVPAGVIIPFAGTSVPTGYLLCNGAAVSRTNYANLFAAIGTLYGAGNGSTTFNLPDARDRVLQGASGTHSAGSYIAAGLPNITGSAQSTQVGIFHTNPNSYSGALSIGGLYPYVALGESGSNGALAIYINASRSSSYYGASNTVQPPAIATNFIIKY